MNARRLSNVRNDDPTSMVFSSFTFRNWNRTRYKVESFGMCFMALLQSQQSDDMCVGNTNRSQRSEKQRMHRECITVQGYQVDREKKMEDRDMKEISSIVKKSLQGFIDDN